MPERIFDRVRIGGQWVVADRGTFVVTNPATGEPAGRAPECSPEQAVAATQAAREAFDKGPWSRMSGAERSACLRDAARRYREGMRDLVDLVIDETGALAPIAERLQVGEVVTRFERNADLARESATIGMAPLERPPVAGSSAAVAAGMVIREPVGVVVSISPFNFPMTNCAGKIAPALAVGNTVVVKPPPQDPMGTGEMIRLIADAFPDGVVNYVCGSGPDVGEALVGSPHVDMISFTGSTGVGIRIEEVAARSMKRTLQELGGKSANLVFEDADLDRALSTATSVWSFHSGQICIAPTRLLVQESIYESFTSRMVALAGRLKIGDPREAGVVVGPVISAGQLERIDAYVKSGVAEGARVACGGKRPPGLDRGFYYEPTLLVGVRNDMRVAREEIFGPVIVAIPFRDEAEAIAIANDSEFGLYGYVWTRDAAKAMRVARAMRTGTVQVNGAPPNPDAPFGGFKKSGVGRDGGRFGIEAYSEIKYVGVAL